VSEEGIKQASYGLRGTRASMWYQGTTTEIKRKEM
jgi:hypothetical protein